MGLIAGNDGTETFELVCLGEGNVVTLMQDSVGEVNRLKITEDNQDKSSGRRDSAEREFQGQIVRFRQNLRK